MKKASRKRKASARAGEGEAEPAKQRRGGGGAQSKKKSKQREGAGAGAVSEAPSSCPATESMDFASAVQLAVSQATQFPLGNDDSHLSIGSCCRVYWDDDDQWFTARVLLYDPGRRLHFIYYDEVCLQFAGKTFVLNCLFLVVGVCNRTEPLNGSMLPRVQMLCSWGSN